MSPTATDVAASVTTLDELTGLVTDLIKKFGLRDGCFCWLFAGGSSKAPAPLFNVAMYPAVVQHIVKGLRLDGSLADYRTDDEIHELQTGKWADVRSLINPTDDELELIHAADAAIYGKGLHAMSMLTPGFDGSYELAAVNAVLVLIVRQF